MPKFLPNLRRGGTRQVETKVVTPITTAFASYYNDLAAAGIRSGNRGWTVERAVTEGHQRIVWVFKSVNTIGADSARLPFRLREGDDEVDDHPLYRVLNKKANPIESGQIFRKRLSAQVMLSPRGAFVECTRSNGNTIKRLDLLPPDRTEIIPGTGNDLISHYRLARKDGTYRNLDPENVRWFRDPHPTDPYMGVTPLEAAGLSVELDHFARLYNVSFMQNDGRPGGVLAVRKTDGSGGDIDPKQMDRLEARFGRGPVEAGKLSVVAGDLTYIDTATRPRDMAYGATSSNSKMEILSAFGMSEVVMGHSADQTFANSDAALYNYWTRTLPAHNEILLTGFDEDSDDDLEGYFDTSGVEVLERAEKAKREEARTEFEAGLRSIISYARLAGYEDEIEETAHTRALYVASGRTPLPARVEDMEALGLGTVVDTPPAAPGAPADAPPAVDAAPAPAALPPGAPEAPAAPAAAVGAGPTPAPGSAAAVLASITGKSGHLHAIEGGRPKARAVYRLSTKAAPAVVESSPDLAAADRLETTLAGVLHGLGTRWTERAVARLGSPKQRKHTRHWAPEYPADTRIGTKALDAAKAVDEDTWRTEAEDAVLPLLTRAAVAAVVALWVDLDVHPPAGVTRDTLAGQVITGTVRAVTAMIGAAAAGAASVLVADVNRADQEGETIEAITDLVRRHAAGLDAWSQSVATRAATATINAARNDAAREAVQITPGADEVVRTWVSRRDEKVRFTHDPVTGADGQTRGLDEPFIVGASLLRHPGDPLAPLKETANCRCFLRHRMTRTGRFVSRPDTKARRTPRDGDNDGRIYDGTPREQPAPRRMIDVETPDSGHSIRTQMLHNVDWRRGYEQTWERMKGEPREAREQASRDLGAMVAGTPVNTSNNMLLSGALAALTDLHAGAVEQTLNSVYDKNVSEQRNPMLGKRIGPVRKAPQARSATHLYETVGGRREGETVDRLLWRVEKRDGVWGVYPPTEQSPAHFSAGTKREAMAWAMDRANGIPDPDE